MCVMVSLCLSTPACLCVQYVLLHVSFYVLSFLVEVSIYLSDISMACRTGCFSPSKLGHCSLLQPGVRGPGPGPETDLVLDY